MRDKKIEDIVKMVLSEVHALQDANQGGIQPKDLSFLYGGENVRTAVLKKKEKYEIEEYPLPVINEKEVVVKVEGCCLSFSDTVEFLREHKEGYLPACGQQGTGTVVKLGSEIVTDAMGKPLKTGDKVIGFRKNGYTDRSLKNEIKDKAAKTWYSNYMVFQADTQLYKAETLDLDSRLLVRNMLEINGEVTRICKRSPMNQPCRVVILGCKLQALLITVILKCRGFHEIIVIGEDEERLRLAKMLGAKETVISSEKNGIEGVQGKIKRDFDGNLADMVFLCTDKMISRGMGNRFASVEGCVYDLSHLVNRKNDKAQNYEESLPINSPLYSEEDYRDCLHILEEAMNKKLPLYRLITHRFSLDQINEAHWAAVREEGLLIGIFNR